MEIIDLDVKNKFKWYNYIVLSFIKINLINEMV